MNNAKRALNMRSRRITFGFVTIWMLIAFSCSDKKDTNPLVSNNTPPTLQITGFAADTLVYVEDNVYPFELVANDDDNNDLEVTARSIGGRGNVSIVDQTANGVYKGEYEPFDKGGHQIEVTVSDGLTEVSETADVFFGDNQLPTPVIVFNEIERDISNRRFSYEFDASQSHDRDSEIVKVTWNLDGAIKEGSLNETLQHTFNYYADYNIELTLEDEFGGIGKSSVTIDNAQPVASFAVLPDNQVRNGDEVTLDAAASASPRAQIATYKWFTRHSTQGINVLGEEVDNLLRYDVSLPVGDDNFIGLMVTDDEGNFSDTTWVRLMVINTLPQVDFQFSTELERIVITANQATDIDPGDELSFSWFLNDQQLSDHENERQPSISVRGDVYALKLVATDNHGGANSTTKTVSVPGVPEAQFVFPGGVEQDFTTKNGNVLSIDGSSSIPGNESNGVESFVWLLRNEVGDTDTLSQGRQETLQLTVNHPVGAYLLGLKVRNLEGLESVTLWRDFAILNSDPTAEFTFDVRADLSGMIFIILTNDSADPDPFDTVSYRWFLDCTELEQFRDNPTPTIGASLGEHILTLKVVDSHGAVGEKSVGGECN